MDKNQLADALSVGVFSDRGTDLNAAYEFVNALHETLPSEHRAPAHVALHVLVNTIANCIRALPDPLASPPAEVTLKPADDPSRGSWSESELHKLIDSRISEWVSENIDFEHEIEQYIDDNVDFTDIIREELRNNLTLTVHVD